MSDYTKTVEIFSGSSIESMGVLNLLESKGIPVFEDNALMATIEPFAVSPGGFNASVLKVTEDDYEKAVAILQDYDKGLYNLDDN